MRKNVEFNSKGSKIRGVLVTPEGGKGPFPVAVMGGGWCYVKEIVLQPAIAALTVVLFASGSPPIAVLKEPVLLLISVA